MVGGVLFANFGISGLAVSEPCLKEALSSAELCRQRLGTTPISHRRRAPGFGAALLVAGGMLLGILGPRRLVEAQAVASRSRYAPLRATAASTCGHTGLLPLSPR